jgi:hypothetical protein
MRHIRDLCPAVVDTLYYAYEEMGRALLYSDSGVAIQAQQYLGSEDATQPPLDEDAPPTHWRISGQRVVFGGDIPFSSSWNALAARLTVTDISGETARLVVRFEELPNVYVYLAEDVDVLYERPREEWIAAIPGETRIDHVVVTIRP